MASAKETINNANLLPQLTFIESNFGALPKVIEKLQGQTQLLTSSVEEMEKIAQTDYPGPVGKKINDKVRAVLSRNCGWDDIRSIAKMHRGEAGELAKEEWTIQDVLAMKYAPVTSADVERSFSKLKYLLSDRRINFTTQNLAAHLILFYNK